MCVFVCEECRNGMLSVFSEHVKHELIWEHMSAILQSRVTVEEVREFEGLQCNRPPPPFP